MPDADADAADPGELAPVAEEAEEAEEGVVDPGDADVADVAEEAEEGVVDPGDTDVAVVGAGVADAGPTSWAELPCAKAIAGEQAMQSEIAALAPVRILKLRESICGALIAGSSLLERKWVAERRS